MTYFGDGFYAPSRTPEDPPTGPEADEYNDILRGVLELGSFEDRMSGADFVLRAREEVSKAGIELEDHHLTQIMKLAFGNREAVLERLSGMSEVEFNEIYPGEVADLLVAYVFPPIR